MGSDKRPHVTLISHSPVIYWWPAIVAAYVVALVTYLQGAPIGGDSGGGYIHPSNNPGLLFITVIALLIIFTNAKLKGVYSLLTIAVIAFLVVLLAWLGLWDRIWAFIPQLSARANAGFYLVFGNVLLFIWLCAFFIFDRTTFWRIYPGQIVEERLVGGASHSQDTDSLVFEKQPQDLFKHIVLGLGSGDVKMSAAGRDPTYIPNVFFVEGKIREAQKLIAIKPDAEPAPDLVMPTST